MEHWEPLLVDLGSMEREELIAVAAEIYHAIHKAAISLCLMGDRSSVYYDGLEAVMRAAVETRRDAAECLETKAGPWALWLALHALDGVRSSIPHEPERERPEFRALEDPPTHALRLALDVQAQLLWVLLNAYAKTVRKESLVRRLRDEKESFRSRMQPSAEQGSTAYKGCAKALCLVMGVFDRLGVPRGPIGADEYRHHSLAKELRDMYSSGKAIWPRVATSTEIGDFKYSDLEPHERTLLWLADHLDWALVKGWLSVNEKHFLRHSVVKSPDGELVCLTNDEWKPFIMHQEEWSRDPAIFPRDKWVSKDFLDLPIGITTLILSSRGFVDTYRS